MKVDKITIIGGGSAGWMSAASLINAFPDKEIIVVESPDFPTIGVGESTLQYIRPWMYSLGIKDEDWMDACNATHKISIRFENWDGKGGHFHYPFGMPQYADDTDFDYYNFSRLAEDVPDNEWAEVFFPAALMAENNLLVERMEGWDLKQNSAYHFDAVKFAQWLKNEYCLPRGVKIISQTVYAIDTNNQGIERIHCDVASPGVPFRADNALTSDLWIDCTGFKALLMNAIGSKFRDYGGGLVNDSAWVTQLPESYPNQYHTNCTTLNNGWVWNTPTANRTGTGYVFSSRYVDNDQALEEFKEHLNRDDELQFRLLTWKHGRQERMAKQNVVAIGLAAGFIEPLESGGLLTTHESLNTLVKCLQRGVFNGGEKAAFNYAMGNRFDDFADFVVMHYQYATRDDTPYWKDAHLHKLKNNNAADEFYTSTHKESRVIPFNAHYNAIAFGQGLNTVSNYDVKFEELFGNPGMLEDGKKFREWILKRQEGWLKYIKENAI